MSRRVCYVTSDLHLGAGAGDRLEDFHQDEAFAAWVGSLDGPATTLVLNGDVVDFAQIEPLEPPDGVPSSLLWDEATSMAKFARARNGHPAFFDALGDFLGRGGTLIVIIGNHDLDLIFPPVQADFRQRVGSPGDASMQFEVAGVEIAGVWIQHGHQFTPENCPKDPLDFLHPYDDGNGERLFLERVWGTDFVLSFYNRLELEFPFADNAKPAIRVLAAGVRHRWVEVRHLFELLAFLKRRKLPPDWWKAVLADEPDETRLRDEVTLAHVAGSFSDPEWQQLVMEVAADPELRQQAESALRSLAVEDLAALVEPVRVEVGEGPDEADVVEESTVLRLFRDSREIEAARQRVEHGARHVVFGHTHRVVDGHPLDGQGARLFNPGTWIPRLHLEDPAVDARIEVEGLTLELLGDHTLYVWDLEAVEIPCGDPDAIRLVKIPHDRGRPGPTGR